MGQAKDEADGGGAPGAGVGGVIFFFFVIASEAKQSGVPPPRQSGLLRCARNDGVWPTALAPLMSAALFSRIILNPRLLASQCMLPCTHRDDIPVPNGRTCHEIVAKLCRAFSRRCLVNCPAVRPGSIANPNRPRRHASPCHGRRAEAGGKATRVGAWSKHSGAASDRVNRSNVNRAHALVCAGFCDGADCRPGESRQQLQRRLRVKLPARQRALDRLQRVGRQYKLWTLLTNVPRHHHPYILRELRRDEGVPGRVSKQSPLVLQQPAGRREVQGRRPQAVRTHALVHTAGFLAQLNLAVLS